MKKAAAADQPPASDDEEGEDGDKAANVGAAASPVNRDRRQRAAKRTGTA